MLLSLKSWNLTSSASHEDERQGAEVEECCVLVDVRCVGNDLAIHRVELKILHPLSECEVGVAVLAVRSKGSGDRVSVLLIVVAALGLAAIRWVVIIDAVVAACG